jgi:hypothetical protein
MCSHTILKNSMDKRNKPGLNYDRSFSKIRRHLLRWREPYEKDCCKGSLSCAGTFIIWLRNECANSDAPDANYKEGYTAGYEAGIMTENSKRPETKNVLHNFRVLSRLLLSSSCPIIMPFREKRLLLFTSFRTGHFYFISRRT